MNAPMLISVAGFLDPVKVLRQTLRDLPLCVFLKLNYTNEIYAVSWALLPG